jgi:hypothetical protein
LECAPEPSEFGESSLVSGSYQYSGEQPSILGEIFAETPAENGSEVTFEHAKLTPPAAVIGKIQPIGLTSRDFKILLEAAQAARARKAGKR